MNFLSPYLAEGQWLKGNLHTHTTVSDGKYSLADTIRAYKESAKYDFIVITDHTNHRARRDLYEEPVSTGDFCVIGGREDSFGRHAPDTAHLVSTQVFWAEIREILHGEQDVTRTPCSARHQGMPQKASKRARMPSARFSPHESTV